jgi:hypothetical protein
MDLRNLPAPDYARDLDRIDKAVINWSRLSAGREFIMEREWLWD